MCNVAKVEELLKETAPKAEEKGGLEESGYSQTPTDAYVEEVWEQQMVKGWPRPLHTFGQRQNQINRGTAARIRALEIQNRALEIQVERLEKELESVIQKDRSIFGRVAAEMDKMEAEINRLRLTAQLNSNTLTRLVNGMQFQRNSDGDSDAETQE